ncbi:MAG: alpha/beta hydrolase [Solirubrobacterales bacterium]
MRRVEANGIEIACEDTGGDGAEVVFVHGLGGSANGWLAQLEECRRRGWRGVAHDQRGAGRSSRPPGPYSVELWAEDLLALLDALGVRRPALVGHSVGCMVAGRAALGLGGRLRGLALCGGALRWQPAATPVFGERARMSRSGRLDEIAEQVTAAGLSERCRREDPRLVGLMREMISSNDPEGYALGAEATAEGTMADPGPIRAPVLAFCGSEDPVTPPSAAAEIAAAVPCGAVAEVAGAAHWCMLENPAETNRVLFGFLAGLAG